MWMQAAEAAVSLKNTHKELLASLHQLQQERGVLRRHLREFYSFFWSVPFYTVSQKRDPDIIDCNFGKD